MGGEGRGEGGVRTLELEDEGLDVVVVGGEPLGAGGRQVRVTPRERPRPPFTSGGRGPSFDNGPTILYVVVWESTIRS